MAARGQRTLTGPPRFHRERETRQPSLDDLRAFITLSRTHRSDCGQRHVFVRLDGGERVRLAFGDSCTLEVQPGAHHLRIHNTLVWKNIHFTIELGEHLDFLIANEARWWTWGMVAVLGSAPLFLRVEKRSRL
jgi:hypothetical protein